MMRRRRRGRGGGEEVGRSLVQGALAGPQR